jgi:hypothetical protein
VSAGSLTVSLKIKAGLLGDRRNVPRQERQLGNAVCFIHWGTFRLSPGPLFLIHHKELERFASGNHYGSVVQA